MTNPIPSNVRGWFYLAAALIGVVSGSASAVLLVLGVNAKWQAVVAISLAGLLSALGILSRSNLTIDSVAPTPLSTGAGTVASVPATTTIITTPATLAPTMANVPTPSPSTTEAAPTSGA